MTLLEAPARLQERLPVARGAHRSRRPQPRGLDVVGARAWQWVLLAIGATASVTTTVLVHLAGRSGYWGDEPSHLLHARRFYDSLTPGFGQLGNYWPPLIHWAELPFAWNAWMVRTDLAGQIPAMAMFLAAVAGAYALGVELSGNRRTGALAGLVVVCNPNLLYLQSSAMMESGIVMSLTWVAVWLLRFRRSGRFRDLAWAGGWSAVAVFATWAALILPLYGGLIVLAACRRLGFNWGKTRTFTAAYCVFTGYAVVLWLGWNWYLQNDPLYMIHYRHPPEAQQLAASAGHHSVLMHPTFTRGLLSLGAAALDTFGPAPILIAAIVLVIGVLRLRLLHPLGVTLIGGALLVAEWSRGQGGLVGSPTFAAIEHLSGREATGMNVRYALWLTPFFAGAVAFTAGRWRGRAGVTALVLSLLWFVPGVRGVVTLHSGDMVSSADEAAYRQAAGGVRNAYHGGEVLTSASAGGDRVIWLSGLPARDFVTQFTPTAFGRALRNPTRVAYVLSTPSLRQHLPDATLSSAGFQPMWTVLLSGEPTTLWQRPSAEAVSP